MPSRFQMNYTQFSQFFHSRTKIIFCNITNHVHPLVDSFIYRHVLSKRKKFLRENICNVYKEREEERMNLNFKKKMMQIFPMEFEIQTQTKPTPSIVLNFFWKHTDLGVLHTLISMRRLNQDFLLRARQFFGSSIGHKIGSTSR